MEQATLFADVPPEPMPAPKQTRKATRKAVRQSKLTNNQKLAAFFQSRPNVWIDGGTLASIAGRYAWRTRVSNLRKPPFSMTIENRLRREERHDGTTYIVSEYRYIPNVQTIH